MYHLTDLHDLLIDDLDYPDGLDDPSDLDCLDDLCIDLDDLVDLGIYDMDLSFLG